MRRLIRRPKKMLKTICSLSTAEGDVVFDLKRSSERRTLSIMIDEKAQVRMLVPMHTTDKVVRAFFREKEQWILTRVAQAKRNRAILDQRKFDQDHEFLFLGNKHKLQVIEKDIKRSCIEFDGTKWNVSIPFDLSCEERQEIVKKKLLKWYRQEAEEVLGGRIFHYSRLMGVEPKKIAIRTQKRLWGCCDYRTQTIHLNWQIILSPLKVVDYVVVHEMVHLTIPNHSVRFWKKIEEFMPDFKTYQKWLKTNQMDMTLM